MSHADELARCDREIAAIVAEAHAGNPDVRGILAGLQDWRTEKRMILNKRTTHLNGDTAVNSK